MSSSIIEIARPSCMEKDTRTLKQRATLVGLILDLKQRFPKAVIRGHNEMPGAVPKFCPCFKPSKEFAYLMK